MKSFCSVIFLLIYNLQKQICVQQNKQSSKINSRKKYDLVLILKNTLKNQDSAGFCSDSAD